MKLFISVLLVLMPCSAIAASDCQVVEYPDHNEVVCVGDEKAEPSTQSPTPQRTDLPARNDNSITTDESSTQASSPKTSAPADIPTRDQSVIPTTPIPSKGPGAVIINRQGRSTQTNQQDLQNAIDARKKLIMEHNQDPTVK